MSENSNAKSASRALDILVHFESVRRPQRAIDIAEALQLPRSSTDQLLKTLLNAGYLVFFPDGKTYFPSARLSPFSEWMADTYHQAELSRILSEVHASTGHTVTIAMQNDCFMQVMDYRGDWIAAPVSVGLRTPLVGSAIGGALLTTQGESEVRKLINRALRLRVLKGKPIDLAGVSRLLNAYRQCGFAWTRLPLAGSQEAGPKGELLSVAVPLPRRLSRVPMSLGIAGPAHRLIDHERDIARMMRSSIQRNLPPSAKSAA
jgi:DNA-binding IclR family transcriptional regulator